MNVSVYPTRVQFVSSQLFLGAVELCLVACIYLFVEPLIAGLPQQVEMTVTLHDTTFADSGLLQLTCTEGLSLSADTLSRDGRLTLTDTDSERREMRVILSAFATLTDASDSLLSHEVSVMS